MAMATPPKRSLKRTVASTVEERSPRFLLGSLALAMVISLVAGLGIGIAIGENDNDTSKPAAGITPKPTPTTRRPGTRSTLAPAPLLAVVVRAGPRLLVVSKGTRRLTMTMARGTRVNVVRPAKSSEIKKGSHVLFVGGGVSKSTTTTSGATTTTASSSTTRPRANQPAYVAKAILIVTGQAANRIGSTVTAVTAKTMTFRGARGIPVTISTVGAKVEKTVASTRAKLIRGRHVLVKSKLLVAKRTTKTTAKAKVPRRRVVIEVIALPNGSAFG